MALLILSPSGGTGLPEGSREHRYEITLTLGPDGLPSPGAWQADPDPWPARRLWPGEGLSEGDVQYDEDLGWALRFFRRGGQASAAMDAPLHAVMQLRARLRPGENVTLVEADGQEHAWRVVGLS